MQNFENNINQSSESHRLLGNDNKPEEVIEICEES